MSDSMEMNQIMAKILKGNQSFNVILSMGARGILLIAQHLYRMQKEKLLLGGEVESFEKYIKATGGRFDIVNVPFVTEKEDMIENFKEQLDKVGIRYHILPDLNKKDAKIQVCVFQPDAGRFAGCFKEYIQKQMIGGQMAEEKLLNFTDGHASLVSIPVEEKIGEAERDFKHLKINYALMPDLNVGDGHVQVLVANHDLPRMKQWYQLFRQDQMKVGRAVPEFRTISLDEYQATAQMKAEDYVNTSGDDLKARLGKYQEIGKCDFAQALDRIENQVGTANSYAFENYLMNEKYEMLSIDHETLVEGVDKSVLPETEQEKFYCRIPGTYKENEKILTIPKDQVFRMNTGGRARYLAFVKKATEPDVFDRNGQKEKTFDSGSSLMAHFDKVKEEMAAAQLQKVSEIAQQLTDNVPLPNPVKSL